MIPPSSTSTTLELIDAGKAQFGLADGIDVAQQIAMGHDAQAIMAIVQRPLGAPIALASEHLRSAADLVGRTVGITGVPSDLAVLDTVVAHAGGNPAKVKTVTIGFDGVAYLEAGKIAAFTGYWPDDGVTLTSQRLPDHGLQARRWRRPRLPRARRVHDAVADRAAIRRWCGRSCARPCTATRTRCATPAAASPSCWPPTPRSSGEARRASLAEYLPIFDAGGVPDGTLVAVAGSRRCRHGLRATT